MKFMTYLCFWYAFAFGLYLIQVVSDRWRSPGYVSPQESIIALKEGQTILGVSETAQGIEFALGVNGRDKKS